MVHLQLQLHQSWLVQWLVKYYFINIVQNTSQITYFDSLKQYYFGNIFGVWYEFKKKILEYIAVG